MSFDACTSSIQQSSILLRCEVCFPEHCWFVGHAHVSDKHYMPRLKIKNMCLGKNDANIQNKQIYNKKINWMKIDFSHVRKLSSK